jgi:hypothetical protein
MISPGWLAEVLAAVVIAVALFSAARLAAARGRRRRCEVDADGVHVVMGIAMAGMFVPQLATLPDPVWAAVFAAGAAWFGWRAVRVRRRTAGAEPPGAAAAPGPPASSALARAGLGRDCCPYPVPHLIDCLAMIYALLAVPALGAASHPAGGGMVAGMSGMAGGAARFPVLGLVLALFVCGYVVWLADRIQRFAAGPREAAPHHAALPALAAAAAVPGSGTARPSSSRPGGPARPGGDPGHASPPGHVGSPVPGGDPLSAGAPGPAGGDRGAPAGLAAHGHAGHAAALLAPRAATCCKIAMGVAMGVMLIDLV